MLLETGRIVAIESQGLWVETIQRSACGSCQAQKGCGHSLLAKFGASASSLWVLLEGRDPAHYHLGDEVKIGVPEEVITKGSLFVYMVPLAIMITATLVAHQHALSDALTTLCALAGLVLGAIIVRWCSHLIRFDTRLQPVLIDEKMRIQTIQICGLE
ncbi:MAG: transcriptional regulator [Moraxellaceae bacterium]|nr:MAG: transcriptional regulator [Moraxellaceae bacterium]